MSQDASVQVEEHTGFCNHWSSYRLSLRQTWRELKLRPRSSINWMIDIFAGTITDPKADFTFCLNAGFYFDVFTWALIHAFYYPVFIMFRDDIRAFFRYLLANAASLGNADLEEGEEGERYANDPHGLRGPWVLETDIGFAAWMAELANASLLILCLLVLSCGLIVVLNYFHCYLLYSGVLMSENTCVVFCSKNEEVPFGHIGCEHTSRDWPSCPSSCSCASRLLHTIFYDDRSTLCCLGKNSFKLDDDQMRVSYPDPRQRQAGKRRN